MREFIPRPGILQQVVRDARPRPSLFHPKPIYSDAARVSGPAKPVTAATGAPIADEVLREEKRRQPHRRGGTPHRADPPKTRVREAFGVADPSPPPGDPAAVHESVPIRTNLPVLRQVSEEGIRQNSSIHRSERPLESNPESPVPTSTHGDVIRATLGNETVGDQSDEPVVGRQPSLDEVPGSATPTLAYAKPRRSRGRGTDPLTSEPAHHDEGPPPEPDTHADEVAPATHTRDSEVPIAAEAPDKAFSEHDRTHQPRVPVVPEAPPGVHIGQIDVFVDTPGASPLRSASPIAKTFQRR